MPLQFPAVIRDIRRALLQTFPYAVYFRVTEESLDVLAVLHLRRNPSEARAALAGELIQSLDDDVDEDAEEAWSVEIRRRLLDQLDAGSAKTIPWRETRRRIYQAAGRDRNA